MCGIIGVLSRRSTRAVPTDAEVLAALDRAIELVADPAAAADAAAGADAALRGVPGVVALADRHELVAAITSRLDRLDAAADAFDADLEQGDHTADELERLGAASIALRDSPGHPSFARLTRRIASVTWRFGSIISANTS